jgi:hypothetical protein
MHLTLGTARRACGNPKQFSTLYHFSGWTALPGPRERAGNAIRWALAHTQQIHGRQSITFLNEHTNFLSFLSALHKDRNLYYEKLRPCSKAWTNL